MLHDGAPPAPLATRPADAQALPFPDGSADLVVCSSGARSSPIARPPSPARAVAAGLCLGSPLRFQLEQRGDVHELTRAVAERVTAELGEGPVEGGLAAFVVTAQDAAR